LLERVGSMRGRAGRAAPAREGRLLAAVCSVVAPLALLVVGAPAGAATCANEEFRTGPSAMLPDCRAYEQVTPPFKEAARTEFEPSFVLGGLTGVSADGLHVDVASIGNFGDAHSSVANNSYELTRGAAGWSETNIDLSAAEFPYNEPYATTPDYTKVLYVGRGLREPLTDNDIVLGEVDGSQHDLGPIVPPAAATGPSGLGPFGIEGEVESYSADLSHIVFGSNIPWPGDTTSLYEYVAGQSGPPAPVGVAPDGTQCQATIASRNLKGAVSADGSVIYFKVPAEGCSAGVPAVGELFARVQGTHTVSISEPSPSDCSACDTDPSVSAGATFLGASTDGSKAFFATSQPLLGSEDGMNIYEYDFDGPAGQKLTKLTDGDWGVGGPELAGSEENSETNAVKLSNDDSHLYFIARGVLDGVVNASGQAPVAGGENLYVLERDASAPQGRTSFVATLAPGDFEELNASCIGCQGATATPDGSYLVFASHADITPGDTSTARQIFEYDAQTGGLTRVSIGQGGFNDDGNTDLFDASTPSEKRTKGLAVSNDGRYVAFESPDGLTPQALNGFEGEFEWHTEEESGRERYLAENVYEYHDGNVYLISDGQDTAQREKTSAVHLMGMSASGRDIFFSTADGLVSQDVDSGLDLYDARIEGGFPAPASVLPSCSGDACQGNLSSSPVLLAPGSELQAGGNPPLAEPPGKGVKTSKVKPKPKACRKGYRRKHGRCVRVTRSKKSVKGRR